MTKKLVVFTFLLTLISGILPAQDTLRYWVNLKQVTNGKIQIEAELPRRSGNQIIWQMPAIVPGTYKIYNFGRYVSDFTAYGTENILLKTEPADSNSRIIYTGNHSTRIQYKVHHTWDYTGEGKSVFYPAGTRFIQDEVFMFNGYAALGYLAGEVQNPIRVNFIIPQNFYAGTAAEIFSQSGDTLSFVYANYHELADSPILFSKPETAVLRYNETQVLISVYDPNKIVSAKKISEELKRILDAQQQYLGGTLPVKKYAFLIYIDPDFDLFGGFGALEHNTSSMYYLPAMEKEWILEQIKDIGAHEFFHIVTPLNLHSEEIHNFDYQHPRMSQHLWLYEGVTEYSAALVQMQYDIKTEKEFIETLREKIKEAANYNENISFTEMSKGCLDTFEDQYQNVYEKGALIGLCLDLTLRKYMPDHSGLAELLQKLSNEYGKHKAFQDSELFTIIEKNSVPQAGNFLREYVANAKPLPLTQILEYAGYIYLKEKTSKGFTLGGAELSLNPETNRLMIWETSGMDKFGKKVGFKTGDEFLKVNGKEITLETIEATFADFFSTLKEGDKVEFELLRTSKSGKSKKLVKSAKMIMVDYTEKDVIEILPVLSEEQTIIRNAWLRRLQK